MTDLARLLAWVADDLDGRGYPFAAVVRRAAQELATTWPVAEHEDGCAGCGGELVQPVRGRKRKWCSEECRRAA